MTGQAAARSTMPPYRHSQDHHWQLRTTVFEEKPLDARSNGAPSASLLVAKACWGSYVTKEELSSSDPAVCHPEPRAPFPLLPQFSSLKWQLLGFSSSQLLPPGSTDTSSLDAAASPAPCRDPNTCPSAQGSPRRTEQHMLFHLLWLQACDINTFSFKFTLLDIKHGS